MVCCPFSIYKLTQHINIIKCLSRHIVSAFYYEEEKNMDVKVTVIVRVLSLILVLVNQWLSNKEVSPIPVDESTLMTIAVALITMWKDNPFTDAAKESNKLLKELKTQKKYEKVVMKIDDK